MIATGKLLVYNQPSYEVMLVMREIQPFDTLDFCNILGITKELFVKRIAEIKNRRLNPRLFFLCPAGVHESPLRTGMRCFAGKTV